MGLDESVELFADAGCRGIPLSVRKKLTALAQLGAQCALLVLDIHRHAPILRAMTYSAPAKLTEWETTR
ncbi:hypothetical protein [Microbacterium sp. CH12i]|uniref:hypothetical protein n=1 Tax=Microbacterium sp. CH12i TaxID=1479651 RepID=UPI000AE1F0B6|nr:hypothetical protein [Microbacterium sp. CH12i]